MQIVHEPSQEVVSQLQQMLDTPIEDQAALYELALLHSILENGITLLKNSDTGDETREILQEMIKSAFVIGRRHANQLI